MTDVITRSGSLRNGIIRFDVSYRRCARWDDRQGWLDWSGVGEETTSAFPPSIRIAFTGNIDVLREAGCIDERMWLTMRRGPLGGIVATAAGMPRNKNGRERVARRTMIQGE